MPIPEMKTPYYTIVCGGYYRANEKFETHLRLEIDKSALEYLHLTANSVGVTPKGNGMYTLETGELDTRSALEILEKSAENVSRGRDNGWVIIN